MKQPPIIRAPFEVAPSLWVAETVDWDRELQRFLDSQESGPGVGAALGARTREVSRCDRGSASILMLFMGLVIYALAAMVWNTGTLTAAKMETQTAADTAAYSTAVWNARAVNMITAANKHSLRDASAMGVSTAMGVWGVGAFIQIMIQTVQGGILIATSIFPPNPVNFALGTLMVTVSTMEWTYYFQIMDEAGYPWDQGFLIADLFNHISKLFSYQQAWEKETPGRIAQQVALLEAYYDCHITLVSGTGGQAKPPIQQGNFSTAVMPFGIRFLYDALAKGSWYSDLRIKVMGKMWKGFDSRKLWLMGSIAGLLFGGAKLGAQHYTLVTTNTPLEVGPYGHILLTGGNDAWQEYSVLAVARKRDNNATSAQFPPNPLDLMAPGVFGDGTAMAPVAVAQAETFNGVDGMLDSIQFGNFALLTEVLAVYPWRVWTDWGWQWQARLTHANLLHPNAFVGSGVNLTPDAFSTIKH